MFQTRIHNLKVVVIYKENNVCWRHSWSLKVDNRRIDCEKKRRDKSSMSTCSFAFTNSSHSKTKSFPQ
uniref:Uncharacterized protein n=1 Tax=Daphnia magna TaxID=35525 RepID=A0A0P6CPY0_9CRUS